MYTLGLFRMGSIIHGKYLRTCWKTTSETSSDGHAAHMGLLQHGFYTHVHGLGTHVVDISTQVVVALWLETTMQILLSSQVVWFSQSS